MLRDEAGRTAFFRDYRLSMQYLPTFASSIHSLFNPIEIMKLKQIFMLLGAVLLGLTACSKGTPNNPDLSKTLAGTEWEATVRESDAGNKSVVTTIVLKFVDDTKFTSVLKFIDDTKFTSQSTQQTIKNGAVVGADGACLSFDEADDTDQGTYTYQGGVATLLFNTRDDEDNAIKLALPLTMDSSKQQLTGKAPESGTILTFVRKK